MISAVVLTKNEEKNIQNCLKTLSFCDEIIVIDDNSDDETLIIAKKMNARTFTNTLHTFSDQRNFGLSKASGDWVLFVDADERVSESLAYEISNIKFLPLTYNGYFLRRFDCMWGKMLSYGEVGNAKRLRLARKSAGKWQGAVHERWNVKGKIGVLQHPLLHYPHQSVSEFLKDVNIYTSLRAEELYGQKVNVYFWDIIVYPKAKFLLNYFLRRGFLDGVPGIIVAIMMSFHSFLVRGKLWLLWQKK